MARFDRTVIIFNPASTGEAPRLAEQLRRDLEQRLPGLAITLQPTRYAGHARELAREAAASGCPLVVSVSGDGGYSEVVDGVMKSGNDQVVCTVLAAGNANDHSRSTRRRPLADAIALGDIRRIDLLRLTVGTGTDVRVQYAHSYIGLGLTPTVAIELERGGKGSLREIVSTLRTFARFRPFVIELTDGTHRSFDSLVFANIAQMAKYAAISDDGRPDDGRFEVIMWPHTAKWRVLGTAVKAITLGLGPQPSEREYRFTTVKPMPMQVDGEVLELAAGQTVAVDIAAKALATIA